MDLEQLGLQLGIAGALIYAFVKVALVLIEKWSKAEEARTKALADGFTSLVTKVDAHHTADIQSHQELSSGIAEIKGKLDERNSTPVEGVPIELSRPTPRPASQPGYYGPRKPAREEG